LLIYVKANMGLVKTPLYPAMQLAQKSRRSFGARASRIGRRGHIGLGWAIRSTPNGNVIVHAGDVAGYTAFVGFTADHKRGVVVLANSLEASADVAELAMAVLAADLPVPPIYAGKGLSLPKALLDQYTGKYAFKKLGITVTISREDDQLYGRSTHGTVTGPKYSLKASARDTFFINVAGGISLTFERNAHGKVDRLVWHQAGQTLTAARQP
jgi:hypothetical protein